MEVNCAGRKAVVTAGASGIGKVIAETLYLNGADVCICDLDKGHLRSFAESRPDIKGFYADVSCSSDVKHFLSESKLAMGGVDILVNNAGIAGPTKKVENISDQEWQGTIAVDVDGQFYCVRSAVPMMRDIGRGTIVNISSTAGRLAFPLRLPYATAKRAVIGFTDTLAMELGPSGINVNAVLPGYVLNERARVIIEQKAKASGRSEDEIQALLLNNISMRTSIEEQEVADLVLYLCSYQGRHISGQAISIDANLETYSGLDKL